MLWHTIHVRVAIVKFDPELPFPYEISTLMASHPKQLPHTSPFHVLVVFFKYSTVHFSPVNVHPCEEIFCLLKILYSVRQLIVCLTEFVTKTVSVQDKLCDAVHHLHRHVHHKFTNPWIG